MTPSIFTPQELDLMRSHYFSLGPTKLAKLMPGKTSQQIASRGAYEGLKYNPDLIGQHLVNREDLSHLMNIATPFAAYMLGFLWADGTVSKDHSQIVLRIVDSDFQDIRERWMATAKLWTYKHHKSSNPNHQDQAIVRLSHVAYHDFLVDNDYRIKSGASADKILSRIPAHFKHYWWRGYFDGDGGFTVSGATRRVSLASCLNQDWRFFNRLAKQLGLAYRIPTRDVKGNSGSSVIMDNETSVRRFLGYIYQGQQFGLRRKHVRYTEYLRYKATIRPNKTSQYRGVSRKRDKWVSAFYKGRIFRSTHATEIEAAQEYDRLARKMCGDKAVLNFS